MKMSKPVHTYPIAIFKSALLSWLLKFITAIPKKTKERQISLIISTTFVSLFLYGMFMKVKRAIMIEVNMRIGRAYIGFDEKTPIARA